MKSESDIIIAEVIIEKCNEKMQVIYSEMELNPSYAEIGSKLTVPILCDKIEAMKFLDMDTTNEELFLSDTLKFLNDIK